MKDITYLPNHPDTIGWKERHMIAVRHHPVGVALQAWCQYAELHKTRFSDPIGEDYFLGPAWRDWGLALRVLLNGELGDMDGGTLDTIIADNLTEQGFEP